MSDTPKLEPCPFCGGRAQFRKIPNDEGIVNAGGEFIECCKCGASTNLVFPLKDDVMQELLERWNRRASPSAAREMRDGVCKHVLQLKHGESMTVTINTAMTGCPYCHIEALKRELAAIRALPVAGERDADDPIVGHKTLYDGSHVPLRKKEVDAMMARIDLATEQRRAALPDERSAINAMFNAYDRLRELGWREAMYCPKDGSSFSVLEPGSTGIHTAHYQGEWATGCWWIESRGDLWPSHPILFKLSAAAPQGKP